MKFAEIVERKGVADYADNALAVTLRARHMGNKHFGNLADVFKHLALAEVLGQVKPLEYWESHAGAAMYAENGEIPSERRHGVHGFKTRATDHEKLRLSHYARALQLAGAEIPGSPMIASLFFGAGCRRMLLCDTDSGSLVNIREKLQNARGLKELGPDALECVPDDGTSVLRGACLLLPEQWASKTVAFIDPYDIHEETAAGISPLALACELANRGIVTLLFYCFADEAERRQQQEKLKKALDAARLSRRGGWLMEGAMNHAAAPTQWGFGMLALNLTPGALAGVHDKLTALEAAYEAAEMENGTGKIAAGWKYSHAAV
jgi:23S rRNA A2030 N6-methylase RlmJ